MKEVHIFDLDDTLTKTPKFSDFLAVRDGGVVDMNGKFSDYLKSVYNFLHVVFSKYVEFHVVDGDVLVFDKNKRQYLGDEYIQYIIDVNKDEMSRLGIKKSVLNRMPKNFESCGGNLCLRPFAGFHADPDTIGKELNQPVYDVYKTVKNRMILTGRNESLRPLIEAVLFGELKIDRPEYGLNLYNSSEGITHYKNRKIEESIIENNWDVVHFYEDRKDWLDNAERHIGELFPNVKFVKHFVG